MPPKSARLRQQTARREAAALDASSPPPSNASSPSLPPLPSLCNTTTAQSISLPPPPLLLNRYFFASSATAGGDAPVAAPLSIWCKNRSGQEGVVRKRRVVISNKTSKIVKTIGGKIKLVWSDFHNGPHSNDNRNILTCDIGTAVRAHVPMLASTFYELEDYQKEAVEKYLEQNVGLH